ncbi:Uu.00g139470.m01.CDS01 [Anthostomella pinea]|uniref:Uu.00g139470.m01.CDS01 n=1 Tax=Anthostomella pinea TaxID=933095 RepID=A0AAI8VPV3_9PEZI|nr:Uu.00g139470.m01.CDS01 [Anthostomella pinea]
MSSSDSTPDDEETIQRWTDDNEILRESIDMQLTCLNRDKEKTDLDVQTLTWDNMLRHVEKLVDQNRLHAESKGKIEEPQRVLESVDNNNSIVQRIKELEDTLKEEE